MLLPSQTALEKQNKALHGDIGDKTQRLDDLHTSLAEADITKKKLSVEKADLEKQIDEADKTVRALGKIKSSLTTQVSTKWRLLRLQVWDFTLCHTLSWKLQQQEKKVQAMRLHPSSNFPISGLKLIEKQIF